MSKFTRSTRTNLGDALYAKVLAGKCTLTFSHAATGDGVHAATQDLKVLKDLSSKKQTFDISSVDAGSTYANIHFIISNASLASGYYIREMGVYATDPDVGEVLYSVTSIEEIADYIEPGTDTLLEFIVNYKCVFDDAENIKVTVASDGYASAEELQALKIVVDGKAGKRDVSTAVDNIMIGARNYIPGNASAWEQGSIAAGVNATSNMHIRTIGYVAVVGAVAMLSRFMSGYDMRVEYYDSSTVFLSESPWLVIFPTTIALPTNTAYARFVIRKSDNTTAIVPAEIANTKFKFELGNKVTDWTPSPDDLGFVLYGTLTAGETSVMLNDARITDNSTMDIYVDQYGVNPINVIISANSVVLTFSAQTSNVKVKVVVK